jgi:urease accessory protein
VVFGVVAERRGLSQLEVCLAHTYSFVTGLLGAAQRLGRFGHTEIQATFKDLQPVIETVCKRHLEDDIAAMSSFAPLAEIMGMCHERAGRRLFMSYSNDQKSLLIMTRKPSSSVASSSLRTASE